jgi:hypothetical protein
VYQAFVFVTYFTPRVLTEGSDHGEIGEIIDDSIREIISNGAHDEISDEGQKDDMKKERVLHREGLTALEIALSCIQKQDEATATDVFLLKTRSEFVARK